MSGRDFADARMLEQQSQIKNTAKVGMKSGKARDVGNQRDKDKEKGNVW